MKILMTDCRRAKLKRLTTDDQERMRRSRALPENFDFSQTLQPNLREARPSYGSVLTEPLMLGVNMSQRPSLRLGTGYLSTGASSMNTYFSNNVPSPVSATGSTNPSPVSSINEGSDRSGPCFSATHSPVGPGPQFTNPFGRSHSLSVGSTAFQRQGRSLGENSMMGLGGHPFSTTSPSNPSLADKTCGFANLPPLQFTRPPTQTRDSQRFGKAHATEGFSRESDLVMNQHYISPLSSPSNLSPLSYDQSQMPYPSGYEYRPAPYYQSPDSSFWQGNQMSTQKYHYGSSPQHHETSEQRPGSRQSQTSMSHDASITRYDQRSHSHSGHYPSKINSPAGEMVSESNTDTQPRINVREGSENGLAPLSAANSGRPRARSDTFPNSTSYAVRS